MKSEKILSTVFYAIGGMLFLYTAYNIYTNTQNPYWTADKRILPVFIVCILAGAAFIFIASRTVINKAPMLSLIAWAALIGLQITAVKYLSVKLYADRWDMNVVYNAAAMFVESGVIPENLYEYFLLFPNNSALYNIYVMFFKTLALFGVKDTRTALIAFNVVIIDIAVLFTELGINLLTDKRFKGSGILMCLFTVPFTLYSVLPYTDTFSMVFLSAGMYFYIRIIKNKGNPYLNTLLFAAAVAAGAVVKVTVIILLIAAAISIVVRNSKTENWQQLLCLLLVSCLGCYFPLKALSENSPCLPDYNYNYSIPYTHWVMMGLEGLGGYLDSDYQQVTLKYPDKASRQAAHIEVIKDRISSKGTAGMVRHLRNKLSYIYSDGTFGAMYKLDWSAVQPTELHDYVLYNGARFSTLGHYSLAYMICVLLLCGIGCILGTVRKDSDGLFMALCITGLTVFLLIWEARSRYLLNFLPLYLTMAAFTADKIFAIYTKKDRNTRKLTDISSLQKQSLMV